jgi:hypothetical protein
MILQLPDDVLRMTVAEVIDYLQREGLRLQSGLTLQVVHSPHAPERKERWSLVLIAGGTHDPAANEGA